MRDSSRVLIALVAALIGGAVIAASGNATLLRAADHLAPVGTLWVNGIRMTVIPLLVSLLITAVASATSYQAIGRIGGRTVLIFALLLFAAALLVLPVALHAFAFLPHDLAGRPPLPAGAAEAAGQLGAGEGVPTFGTWLASLLPSNPVAAAANGAIVPLILFTLLLALAIARSPTATRERLVGFFEALGEALLLLVRWVIALAPIGVFALVLPLAAHGGGGVAGAVGAYIAVYSIASVIGILLLYPVVALLGRVPVRRFARAALPGQLIAFSSSSSIAALPALVEGAERELGLPGRVTGFVLPVAISTFHLAAPISWTVGAMFVAWFYGIALHFQDIAMVAFASVLFSFAAPGVPRGAFLMLTPLFLAIGLPAEGIGILIAVDTIPDLFATALNVTGDLAAAVLVARSEAAAAAAGCSPGAMLAVIGACALLGPRLLAQGPQHASDSAFVRDNVTKYEHRITMRDGINLFTIVYVPKDASASNTYPILMKRTCFSIAPYDPASYATSIGPNPFVMRNNYTSVYQNVRGRYMSGRRPGR